MIIGLSTLSQINSQPEPIDCDTFSPMYFTPSERITAGEAANKLNIVAVIPEENYLIARTEILDCPNFDYKEFIEGDFER